MRILFLMTLAGLAYAQPAFEVVSVKPAQENARYRGCRGGPGTEDPGQWICTRAPLGWLIQNAYDRQPYNFQSPDAVRSIEIDVTAKVPPGTTKEDFRKMQQDMLVRRFHLRFHYVEKEMPVSQLTVSKAGLLKESAGPPLADRSPGPMTSMNGQMNWKATHLSIEEMAPVLAMYVGGPVEDGTGLKGRYDISLSWYREISGTEIAVLSQYGETVVPGEGGPTLKQSLESQMGLKLVTKKGMVPVMVIDSVDRAPVEN